MFLDFRLKVRQFFRKNKKKIYIILIVLALIIAINSYLGYLKEKEPPSVSYKPHNPVISGDEVKDKKTQNTIEDKIKEYMDYCNKKEYENAYNCISDNCKKYKFNNKINNFKKYVDYIFDGEKVYSIQDYSNSGNIYVYQVTISEDILATGMNNENSEEVYEEKIVIIKNGDESSLAVAGYIGQEDKDIVAEDEYMKVKITKKDTTYDKVTYTIEVSNKTNNDIVLANSKMSKEFYLSLNGDYRKFVENDFADDEIAITGNSKKTFKLDFNKYFDESKKETELILNTIKVLENYSGKEENWEEELNHTIKEYSLKISLN